LFFLLRKKSYPAILQENAEKSRGFPQVFPNKEPQVLPCGPSFGRKERI
jgi:hypothetical protein